MTSDLYERARTEGVVVARADRGLVRLTGPQRVWFLQNTITADVEDAASGTWVESCFLEPKGHVIAHMRVGLAEDEVWLDVDPPAAELVDWFVRYRFRTKVELEDASSGSFTVLGPPAARLAGAGELRAHVDAVIFGDRLGNLPVAEVHAAARPEEIAGLETAPDSLYEIFRIEAGVGRFGVDYDSRTLPQEAGLTRVVSVEKGCYVGQEVVARLHFRGHVNKVLRPLTLEGAADVPVGRALLLDGKPVGKITSAAVSPERGPVALATVRVEPEEGTSLEIEGGGLAVLGPVPAGTKVKTP